MAQPRDIYRRFNNKLYVSVKLYLKADPNHMDKARQQSNSYYKVILRHTTINKVEYYGIFVETIDITTIESKQLIYINGNPIFIDGIGTTKNKHYIVIDGEVYYQKDLDSAIKFHNKRR